MESEQGELIVKVGDNTILMQYNYHSQYDKITIKDSSGNVKVYNDWKIRRGNVPYPGNRSDNVTLSGGAGNNEIYSRGDNVTISGGKGNDSLSNDGNESKIFGDAGNDSTYSIGDYVSIFGGKGNDTIESYDHRGTISGGTGKDFLFLSSYRENLIQYASGDGKDTIYGFNAGDTLQITKGSYKTSTKGNDVIMKVGSGSITLKDGKSTKITIIDSSGKTATKNYGSSSFELFAEDNFATTDNLSAIVENNLSAMDYKISAQNFENLTQENNLITFSDN